MLLIILTIALIHTLPFTLFFFICMKLNKMFKEAENVRTDNL